MNNSNNATITRVFANVRFPLPVSFVKCKSLRGKNLKLIMKNLSILIFFVFTTTIGYSQKKITVPDQNKMSLVEVMVAAGISSASSTFSDNSYAADGSFFELSSTYYFSFIKSPTSFK